MDVLQFNIHQVFVKLLDGKHRVLNFVDPLISVSAVKRRIETLTSIPSHLQLLVLENSRILHDDGLLNVARSVEKSSFPEALGHGCSFQSGKFPVIVHLLLRLKGGKGGFGSLLRGAATKAGQKKTNNFDACRDMNGRRLRHVNAEKRLEEWRAEAEGRKLEKMADDFLKKKSKEIVKSGKSKGGDGAEKYVAKYREDSAKCMEEVERSVRESIQGLMGSKRKNLAEGSESAASKRLKIWLGKREISDSDSDSEDLDEEDREEEEEEEEEENEKSVVIDNGTHSDSSKEAETSAGSITDEKFVAESVDRGSSESGPDELENAAAEPLKSDKSTDGESKNNLSLEENIGHNELKEEVAQSAEGINSRANPIHDESVSVASDLQISEKPLDFDECNSAADLEVFGLERLKSELQARGLKCGGTLQERAARLFLLKTTPLEKLPKKLFAKK